MAQVFAEGDGPGANAPPVLTPDDRKSQVASAILALQDQYGFSAVPMEVILAQSKLETGAWTSPLVSNAMNAFGMGMPASRQTTATFYVIGEGGAHMAGYPSLYASVQDYFLRQRNFRIPDTSSPVEYIQATVASGYAADPQYGAKWAQLVKDGLDIGEGVAQEDGDGGGSSSGGIGGLLLILGLGWAFTR